MRYVRFVGFLPVPGRFFFISNLSRGPETIARLDWNSAEVGDRFWKDGQQFVYPFLRFQARAVSCHVYSTPVTGQMQYMEDRYREYASFEEASDPNVFSDGPALVLHAQAIVIAAVVSGRAAGNKLNDPVVPSLYSFEGARAQVGIV